MLWFNKINSPDPGKKAPVIIDVNVKEQQCGCDEGRERPGWHSGPVSWLETAVMVSVCMKPVLMILNDHVKHSITHRTALPRMNHFP